MKQHWLFPIALVIYVAIGLYFELCSDSSLVAPLSSIPSTLTPRAPARTPPTAAAPRDGGL